MLVLHKVALAVVVFTAPLLPCSDWVSEVNRYTVLVRHFLLLFPKFYFISLHTLFKHRPWVNYDFAHTPHTEQFKLLNKSPTALKMKTQFCILAALPSRSLYSFTAETALNNLFKV